MLVLQLFKLFVSTYIKQGTWKQDKTYSSQNTVKVD